MAEKAAGETPGNPEDEQKSGPCQSISSDIDGLPDPGESATNVTPIRVRGAFSSSGVLSPTSTIMVPKRSAVTVAEIRVVLVTKTIATASTTDPKYTRAHSSAVAV